MNKKYSMPTMAKAEQLIMALATPNEDGTMRACKEITSTEATHAIVCLGFQDEIIIEFQNDLENFNVVIEKQSDSEYQYATGNVF